MLRAFASSATGMSAQETQLDVIAHNLANINTPGFKRVRVDFQDLMYVRAKEPGAEVASGLESPTGLEIGSGVRPAATVRVFTQGEMENTGRDMDVAIEGPGFIQVSMPDGETRYTRDGSLHVDASGNMVTSSGYALADGITVPTNATAIGIGKDGTVTAFVPGSSAPSALGQITLARFSNPSGLAGEGGNMLSETSASGSATTGTPGADGLGTLQQGFLERTNVQMVLELVRMITAQRAYEVNAKAIKAGDEMLRTTVTLVS